MTAVFLQAEPTIQTIGADVIRDAQRITYQAQPSGVVYSLLFAPWPSPVWSDETVSQQANEWADRWNENAAQPGVVGVNVTQRVNEAGNLQDVADVYVRSTSGRSTSLIVADLPHFWPDQFAQLVATERGRLDSYEAANPGAVGLAATPG